MKRPTLAHTLILLLVAAPLVGPGTLVVAADPAAGEGARITGTIFAANGKAKVRGAVVQAYHLSSEKIYASEPTGPDGKYSIDELPYGYFDLAVETPDGLFVADQVANVAPSSKTVLSFTLAGFGTAAAADAQPREFPGASDSPSGVASVRQRLTGRDFWKSPKGIAILAGGGGAVLLAIAAGGGSSNETPASPTSPALAE